METGDLQKEEKNLLIGNFTGILMLVLLVLGWTAYIFFGVMKLNFTMMKKLFTDNPEAIAYSFIPLLFILIWVIPRARKLWKDISANKVEVGTAEIINVSRSWVGRDWFVKLNAPGVDKVRLQRKDIYKLTAGKRIKYRIAPFSRILIGYEILNAK